MACLRFRISGSTVESYGTKHTLQAVRSPSFELCKKIDVKLSRVRRSRVQGLGFLGPRTFSCFSTACRSRCFDFERLGRKKTEADLLCASTRLHLNRRPIGMNRRAHIHEPKTLNPKHASTLNPRHLSKLWAPTRSPGGSHSPRS